MADAAKLRLREAKIKIGTKVYVNRTFFYEDGNPDEKFYGQIMKVLPDDSLRVKWDIDNTHSIVSPKDLYIVEEADIDFITLEKNIDYEYNSQDQGTDLTLEVCSGGNSYNEGDKKDLQNNKTDEIDCSPAVGLDENSNNEKDKMDLEKENERVLRKRKNMNYDDHLDNSIDKSYSEDSLKDDIDEGITSNSPSSNKISTKIKINVKTPLRKKRREQNKNTINTTKAAPSGLTVNEALNTLASDRQWVAADLFIAPPDDANCSDEDSADEADPQLHNLSKQQLLAQCQLRLRQNDTDEVVELDGDNNIADGSESSNLNNVSSSQNNWKSSNGANEKQSGLREKVQNFKAPKNVHIETLDNENHNWTHLRTFELFFDSELVEHIVQMTNQYAIEKGTVGWIPLTISELRCFLGILMLSGYVELPSYRMYWEEAPDVQHSLFKNAMPRNRFSLILQNLHFCENNNIDPVDKCGKVRPLLDMMRQRCHKYAILTEAVNVDESMIPYYGKFGQKLKQRMPLKPIRSGYKVWCLNLEGGYLYDFEVYQGKGSKNEFSAEFGLGPSVVLGLIKSLPSGNFSVYIDNFFNSLPLLKHLRAKEIGCTGTIRADRWQDCPLPPKNRFSKNPKGSYQGYWDNSTGIELVLWNDNGAVTMGSNFESIEPVGVAKRWSKDAKDYVNVPRPALIASYNKSMGGTDQMDQAISTYRPSIRNRKWYWPLFSYCVSVGLYNSWLLYRKLERDCSFLDHVRSVATSYLKAHTHDKRVLTSTESVFFNSRVSKRVDTSIRYDGKNHFLGSDQKKSRCALCGKTTIKKCTKCNVKLHDYCFSAFHGLTQ